MKPSNKIPSATPAATLTLIRQAEKSVEVLLLKRSQKLAFGPGSWVFPGGKVEASDWCDGDTDIDAARRAALRETAEEAGLNVAQYPLHYFSHWLTPPGMSRRYATWFFIAPWEGDTEVVVDQAEIVEHAWYTPQQAIDAHNANNIAMMPPTFVTLWQLRDLPTVEQAMHYFRAQPPVQYEPKVVERNATKVDLYYGDAGYEQGDPELPGSRHRYWCANGEWQFECND